MNKRSISIFSLSSITYAIKAQSVLKKEGISSEVIKTPKDMGKGCGYSIRLASDFHRAQEILTQAGIEIKAKKQITKG